MKVRGVADGFIAPASLFQTDETFSWFFGKVIRIRMVRCDDLGNPFNFLIVDVESGLGMIPLAMSYDCFDLRELAVGKVLEVRADIKADLGITPPDA
ncbi:MAG: hypothetical protein K5870_07675 [Lachnospiraceae bacterium]|nr:hypothetical protein [Lachnospiraceae bacterium]